MTEELKPEAAPVEPLCPFTDRPAWECAAACTCAHFKPTAIIGHAHPPAAPTDALVEKVASLTRQLELIRDVNPKLASVAVLQEIARAALAAMQEAGE